MTIAVAWFLWLLTNKIEREIVRLGNVHFIDRIRDLELGIYVTGLRKV